jgi:hypothetical protein
MVVQTRKNSITGLRPTETSNKLNQASWHDGPRVQLDDNIRRKLICTRCHGTLNCYFLIESIYKYRGDTSYTKLLLEGDVKKSDIRQNTNYHVRK